MKFLILPFIIIMCNSCLTGKVTREFSKAHTSRSYPLSKMNKLEGAISKNNNFIISRMYNNKNNTYMIDGEPFRFAQISKNGDEYSISHRVTEKINRFIPVYTLNEEPKKNEEYLKVVSFEKYIINLEYNDPQNNIHTITVNNMYSDDPNFVKRPALVVLLPVAFALDLIGAYATQGAGISAATYNSKYWIHD